MRRIRSIPAGVTLLMAAILLAAPLLANLFVSLLTGDLSYGAQEPLTGVLHPTLDGDLTPG